MKGLLTICFYFLYANMFGQNNMASESDSINLIDQDGLKQGTWILTDEQGNKRMMCNYLNNEIERTINYYKDNHTKLIFAKEDSGNFTWAYIINEVDTLNGYTDYVDDKFRLFLENGDSLDNKTNDEILTISEIYPTYYGGNTAMHEYLKKNLKYPEKAKKKGKTGKVIVQFTIDQNGSITNVHIIESSNKIFNSEALRIVTQMPSWRPGHQRGQMVKVRINLPISFKLNN